MSKERIVYTSPLFNCKFWIPLDGLGAHTERDYCVLKLQTLGGINAPLTEQTKKLRTRLKAARRKIEKNGWWSEVVPASWQG